jgi:tripeptide aminopeptidase
MLDAFARDLESRFLRYVQIDTQSDESSTAVPSTSKQLDLLRLLERELRDLGAHDVGLTKYGCVLATIPATAEGNGAPTVAFLGHVDTAPQFSGTGVKPLVHRRYDGQPIVLPDDPSQVLDPAHLPYLAQKVGDDIITASGKTLLGADDKAGVAICMTLAAHLLAHPEIAHGPVRICFTPDEEIGHGVTHLTLEDLAADVAYTLDGSDVGELVYESWSADKAVVKITGVSIHPGYAFGKLVNALHLAATIVNTLPQHTRTPETTAGRQGFIHLYKLDGTAAAAELHFILRDFEREGLAAHGELLQAVCRAVALSEPRAQIECTITPQYRNMRYWLEENMRPVELAKAAMIQAGIKPLIRPIRGGTDGSRLTERGLPTPNLFTGMQEYHGPLEWISIQDMAKATAVCVNLVQLWREAMLNGEWLMLNAQ